MRTVRVSVRFVSAAATRDEPGAAAPRTGPDSDISSATGPPEQTPPPLLAPPRGYGRTALQADGQTTSRRADRYRRVTW